MYKAIKYSGYDTVHLILFICMKINRSLPSYCNKLHNPSLTLLTRTGYTIMFFMHENNVKLYASFPPKTNMLCLWFVKNTWRINPSGLCSFFCFVWAHHVFSSGHFHLHAKHSLMTAVNLWKARCFNMRSSHNEYCILATAVVVLLLFCRGFICHIVACVKTPLLNCFHFQLRHEFKSSVQILNELWKQIWGKIGFSIWIQK